MSININKLKEEVFNFRLSDKTYSLNEANPKLTGNIKLVVGDSEIFLSSIPINDELNNSTFQNFVVDVNKKYRSNIKNFTDLIFDKTSIYALPDMNYRAVQELNEQYTNPYAYGCSLDIDKRIKYSHRFFAPIFIGDKIPDGFAIFKVDNTTSGEIVNENSELIKYFDLTLDTKIGRFLREHKDEIDKKSIGLNCNHQDTFSYVGVDINSGVITEKSIYTKDMFLAEQTQTEFEYLVSKSCEVGNMIDPRYLNIDFMFDIDTNDILNNNKFVDVVGVYFYKDEFDVSLLRDSTINKDNALIIGYDTEYKQVDSEIILTSPLYDRVGEIQANALGVKYPPMGIIKFNSIPNKNETLVISFQGVEQLRYQLQEEDRGSTIKETVDNIITKLKKEIRKQSKIVTLNFRRYGEDEIHIISVLYSVILEDIQIDETFRGTEVISPFIGSFNNNLIQTDNTTILLNSKSIDNTIDGVEFSDGSVAVPNLGYRYIGQFAYKTDIDVSGKDTRKIYILRERQVEYFRIQNIEHRKFDYNRSKSYHKKPMSFDLALYKNYLLQAVNDSGFLGKFNGVTPAPSQTDLNNYRAELRVLIDKFFNSIELESEELLIKEIEKSSFEFTETDNEYDTFKEYEDSDYLSIVLNNFLLKFAIRGGNDVTGNPQRLNTSKIFRYDSFTPDLETSNRDLSRFTNSHYLIASGTPPWYVDGKQGYTIERISSSDLKDETIDAYDKIGEYSIIKTEKNSEITSVFFRGVRVLIPEEYAGYRYSCLLIPEEAPTNADSRFYFIENSRFKTLTLVINQFIPEPVLTSLEGESDYYLDRSVLYFSQGGNSTDVSLSSLGTESISLQIHETTLPKTYNGVSVGTDWLHFDTVDLAHIRLNTSVNNFNLKTMLGLGGDFIIRYEDIDPNAPEYGMEIIFKELVEIGRDYFWCKEIVVNYREDDPLNPGQQTPQTVNIVADYLLDDEIFDDINVYSTAKAVSYYNAVFDRTISNSIGGDRYGEISMGTIFNSINRDIDVLEKSDGTTSTIDVSFGKNFKTHFDDSFYYDVKSKSVKQDSRSYRFDAVRPNGFYDPMTVLLIESQSSNISLIHSNLKYIRKSSNKQYDENIIVTDIGIQNLSESFFDKIYSYSTKNETFPIRWIYSPNELKSFYSRTFSGVETTIELNYTNSSLNIFDVFRPYAEIVLRPYFNNDNLSDYVYALTLYGVNVNNVSKSDIEEIIKERFIKNFLARKMFISNATINGDSYGTILLENTLNILSAPTQDGVVNLNLKFL